MEEEEVQKKEILLSRCKILLSELQQCVDELYDVESEELLAKANKIRDDLQRKTITDHMKKQWKCCRICANFDHQRGDISKFYGSKNLKIHMQTHHVPNYHAVADETLEPFVIQEEQYVNGEMQYFYKKTTVSKWKFCDECRENFSRTNFSKHILTEGHKRCVEIAQSSYEARFYAQETFILDLVALYFNYRVPVTTYKYFQPFIEKYCARPLLAFPQFKKLIAAEIQKLSEDDRNLVAKRIFRTHSSKRSQPNEPKKKVVKKKKMTPIEKMARNAELIRQENRTRKAEPTPHKKIVRNEDLTPHEKMIRRAEQTYLKRVAGEVMPSVKRIRKAESTPNEKIRKPELTPDDEIIRKAEERYLRKMQKSAERKAKKEQKIQKRLENPVDEHSGDSNSMQYQSDKDIENYLSVCLSEVDSNDLGDGECEDEEGGESSYKITFRRQPKRQKTK